VAVNLGVLERAAALGTIVRWHVRNSEKQPLIRADLENLSIIVSISAALHRCRFDFQEPLADRC
jgi:hypothetical protein